MAELQLYQGEANPKDIRLRGYATPAATSGAIGTVTMTLPVVSAIGKAGASAAPGTVVLSVSLVAAHGNGLGSAALVSGGIGDVDMVTPVAAAVGKANAAPAGKTVTLTAPAGSGAVSATAHVSVSPGTVTVVVPVVFARAGQALATGRVPGVGVIAPQAFARELMNAHLETDLSEVDWEYETWLSK